LTTALIGVLALSHGVWSTPGAHPSLMSGVSMLYRLTVFGA
jgi:hypothetical protein